MSQMIEVKTAELIGPSLDWAVAEVCGLKPFNDHKAVRGQKFHTRKEAEGCWNDEPWKPSTDWSQGGPLIDKYRISVTGPGHSAGVWSAHMLGSQFMVISQGATALQAACRRLVVERMGDVVSVPAELVTP